MRILLPPLLALAMGSCAPVVTYPPDNGAADLSTPAAHEPIPTLMSVSIRYAYARYGNEDDFAINLPPGTTASIYEKVIQKVGAGHPMQDPDESAYHITKVMVRGLDGKVDMFYPREDGTYQFVTFTFKRNPFQGYVHESTRVWKTGDQPPPPNYTGAPLEQAAPQQRQQTASAESGNG